MIVFFNKKLKYLVIGALAIGFLPSCSVNVPEDNPINHLQEDGNYNGYNGFEDSDKYVQLSIKMAQKTSLYVYGLNGSYYEIEKATTISVPRNMPHAMWIKTELNSSPIIFVAKDNSISSSYFSISESQDFDIEKNIKVAMNNKDVVPNSKVKSIDDDTDGIPNAIDNDYVRTVYDTDGDGIPDNSDVNPHNSIKHSNRYSYVKDRDSDGYLDTDHDNDGYDDNDHDRDGYMDDDYDRDGYSDYGKQIEVEGIVIAIKGHIVRLRVTESEYVRLATNQVFVDVFSKYSRNILPSSINVNHHIEVKGTYDQATNTVLASYIERE